jgi:hypothetical protein
MHIHIGFDKFKLLLRCTARPHLNVRLEGCCLVSYFAKDVITLQWIILLEKKWLRIDWEIFKKDKIYWRSVERRVVKKKKAKYKSAARCVSIGRWCGSLNRCKTKDWISGARLPMGLTSLEINQGKLKPFAYFTPSLSGCQGPRHVTTRLLSHGFTKFLVDFNTFLQNLKSL